MGIPRGPKKWNTETGFTVVEILIAAGVLGLLALLSLRPMKNYLHRMEFQNSSRNIKHLVQLAQSKAMANPNVHIGVYFNKATTPHRVMLFQDLANPANYNYDGNGDPAYLAPAILKTGTSIQSLTGYPDEIVFRGDGSAWKSMKVVLTDGTLKDTLDVLASTGRVRVGR